MSMTFFVLTLQLWWYCFSVVSDSLQPHRLPHARLACSSLSRGVCSNSCPLIRWCHPTISFSITPFSCPQSFPASGSFPMSQLSGIGQGLSVTTSFFTSAPSPACSVLFFWDPKKRTWVSMRCLGNPVYPRDLHTFLEHSSGTHIRICILLATVSSYVNFHADHCVSEFFFSTPMTSVYSSAIYQSAFPHPRLF